MASNRNQSNVYVYPLQLAVTNAEVPSFIYPSLIQTDKELILVDTGYPGQANAIETAAAKLGLSLEGLTRIVLTHHDIDHTGSLKELKTRYPQAMVIAPHREAAYIDGSQKTFRLQQAEALYPSLPEETKEAAKQFEYFLKTVESCAVEQTVKEGDSIDKAGLIRVIETPGHTEGHISLYLPQSNTLLAGDALVYEEDELTLANPQYAFDLAQAQASAERIRRMNPEMIICYHGGVCRNPTHYQYRIHAYQPSYQHAV